MKYELVKDFKHLTTPVKDFNFFNPELDPLELGKDLLRTCYSLGGVGLAANQCGLPYRVFVMAAYPEDYICFNPTIVHVSPETEMGFESCLSFPGLRFEIERPKQIRLRFSLPDKQRITIWLEGFTARCAIHETMHLDGRLFFEGISRVRLQNAIKKAKKKGHDYDGMGLLAHCG